jgi:hypothetical protein
MFRDERGSPDHREVKCGIGLPELMPEGSRFHDHGLFEEYAAGP